MRRARKPWITQEVISNCMIKGSGRVLQMKKDWRPTEDWRMNWQ